MPRRHVTRLGNVAGKHALSQVRDWNDGGCRSCNHRVRIATDLWAHPVQPNRRRVQHWQPGVALLFVLDDEDLEDCQRPTGTPPFGNQPVGTRLFGTQPLGPGPKIDLNLSLGPNLILGPGA